MRFVERVQKLTGEPAFFTGEDADNTTIGKVMDKNHLCFITRGCTRVVPARKVVFVCMHHDVPYEQSIGFPDLDGKETEDQPGAKHPLFLLLFGAMTSESMITLKLWNVQSFPGTGKLIVTSSGHAEIEGMIGEIGYNYVRMDTLTCSFFIRMANIANVKIKPI